MADKVAPLTASNLQARLWALCSPTPHSEYDGVWASIAGELWAQLAAALAPEPARAAAELAARHNCEDCMKALVGGAPPVYWALSNIRGLALVVRPAAPAPVATRSPATPPRPAPGRAPAAAPAPAPGETLEYDWLSF
jgi:hypothetical protein